MAKRIIWSPQATADRIQILDYWYRRLGTKRYSEKLDEIFRNTIQLLARHPILGRYREEIDARVFVKDDYQIFYRNTENTIHILHLWDSRQDPERLNL